MIENVVVVHMRWYYWQIQICVKLQLQQQEIQGKIYTIGPGLAVYKYVCTKNVDMRKYCRYNRSIKMIDNITMPKDRWFV